MLKKFFVRSIIILMGLGLVLFVAWSTSPDPKFNVATFEETPVAPKVAPLDQALTLASYQDEGGETLSLLVLEFDGADVRGVDAALLGAPQSADPFEVFAALLEASLSESALKEMPLTTVPIAQLLPTGTPGNQHIGIGTNFPEHAEEASSDSVFNFPKFGPPTPARTTVKAPPQGLLDYEVELCMRFDRPIASLADFDSAAKAVFLCGDFTERATLLRLADTDNLDSGYGFSDSKSGPDFFPTGPFLVFPNDWKSFIVGTRMTTEVNGAPRQDARGGEMIRDFRQLVEMNLADISEPRFFYKGDFYKLVPDGRIEPTATLMSGTSEGVIFTAPARHDYIEITIAYLAQGGPLSGKSFLEIAKEAFIESERASGHFLAPGDVVTYRSSTLGEIEILVTD